MYRYDRLGPIVSVRSLGVNTDLYVYTGESDRVCYSYNELCSSKWAPREAVEPAEVLIFVVVKVFKVVHQHRCCQ